jgi:hypothetical protein
MPRTNLITPRQGTAAQWASAQSTAGSTPLLQAGEWAYETDTFTYRQGDGSSLYGALTPSTTPPQAVNATVVASSGLTTTVLQPGINPINAGTNAITATLPTPQYVGQVITVQKDAADQTFNVITISGRIEGTAGQTMTLSGPSGTTGKTGEAVQFTSESLTSWRVSGDRKPKTYLDTLYVPTAQLAAGTAVVPTTGAPASSYGYTGDHALDISTLNLWGPKNSSTFWTTPPQWTLADINSVQYINRCGGGPGATAAQNDAAFAYALAHLPTVNGLQVGEIRFAAGSYAMGGGTVTTAPNQGPGVWVDGAGRYATFINYGGAGDAFRLYNPVDPRVANAGSGGWTSITQWGGGWRGFTLDGTTSTSGANGIHYGDNEGGEIDNLAIQHFNGTGTNVSTGLLLNNTIWWTEKLRAKVMLLDNTINCLLSVNATSVAQATLGSALSTGAAITSLPLAAALTAPFSNGTITVFSGANSQNFTTAGALAGAPSIPITSATPTFAFPAGSGIAFPTGVSFGYNDLDFEIFANPGQDGVSVSSGANLYNRSLRVRGNFQSTNAVANMYRPNTSSISALLRVGGTTPNGTAGSVITNQILDIQAEVSTAGGNQYPYSIYLGSTGGTNYLLNNRGMLSFGVSAGFRPSNITPASMGAVFTFSGIITGDANLNPGNGTVTVGSVTSNVSPVSVAGSVYTCKVGYGDRFIATLAASTACTISLTNGGIGPSTKRVRVVNGGSSTYTFVSTAAGSATSANPHFAWAGGAAPTVSTTTSGHWDEYVFDTEDGVTFTCTAYQLNVY